MSLGSSRTALRSQGGDGQVIEPGLAGQLLAYQADVVSRADFRPYPDQFGWRCTHVIRGRRMWKHGADNSPIFNNRDGGRRGFGENAV